MYTSHVYWVNEFTLYPIFIILLCIGGLFVDLKYRHDQKKAFAKLIWFPYDLEEYKQDVNTLQVSARFIPAPEGV